MSTFSRVRYKWEFLLNAPAHHPTADLRLGDCITGLASLADHSVPLIICDLPFGITGCDWDRKLDLENLWKELRRVLTATGVVLMHASGQFMGELIVSNPAWFKYDLVWEKSNPTGFLHCKQAHLRSHENILVFSPGVMVGKHASNRQYTFNPQNLTLLQKPIQHKAKTTGKVLRRVSMSGGCQTQTNFPRTVLRFDSVSHHGRLHETQKPLDLMDNLIRTFSNEGDVVLDPTMGSGSTGIAALEAGRSFIGFEVAPDIFGTAADRFRRHDLPIITSTIANNITLFPTISEQETPISNNSAQLESLILKVCNNVTFTTNGALLKLAEEAGLTKSPGTIQNATKRLVDRGALIAEGLTPAGKPTAVKLTTPALIPSPAKPAPAPAVEPAPANENLDVAGSLRVAIEMLSRVTEHLATLESERAADRQRLEQMRQLLAA